MKIRTALSFLTIALGLLPLCQAKSQESDTPASGSELAKHPFPKYTDFSKLNSNPRKQETNYRVREFRAYLPVGEMSK